MDKIKTISVSKSAFQQKSDSVFAHFVTPLLLLSFMFANLYSVVAQYPASYFGASNYGLQIFADLIFMALIDWLAFIIILWIYRTILQTKPYFFLVGQATFYLHIKFWYIIRNVVVGLIGLMLFRFPYLNVFMELVNTIMTFLVLNLTFVSLCKHIDVLFRQMFYKLMMWPWFVYMLLEVVFILVMGGVA